MNISLDDKNRLVLSKSAAERLSRGPLKLFSSARTAQYTDGTELPERMALDGTWKLNEKHDLEFGIHASSVWFPGMTLTFKTGLISAKANELVFSARISDGEGGVMGSALAFSGKWQADKNNRITFRITRYTGKSNRLVFQGAWQVGRRNELFYTYSTEKLKKKEKEEFSFGLKGSWALGARRLVYVLGSSTTDDRRLNTDDISLRSSSVLSFSAALQTPSIVAKAGEIRYSVGIRFTSGGKEKKLLRSVAIYGTWKLGRDLALGFEAESTVREKNVISFTAEKLIFDNGKLTVGLKTEDGRKFGGEVTFTKALARDVELFASLESLAGDTRAIGGIRGKF